MDLNRFRIDTHQSVSLAHRSTEYHDSERTREELLEQLEKNVEEIKELQQRLMSEEREGLIFALQALDAAGKDEAERYLFSRLSTQGLRTSSFSKPSQDEKKHDYLWRVAPLMPMRGEIGVFNRSHYEEVIGNRINKSYIEDPLPEHARQGDIWEKRYKHIRNFEEYLYDNGFYMIKIYLHVSKDVQKERLLERLEDSNHQWEFSFSDLDDRERWDEYMEIFEETFHETSTEKAPWYIIPADDGDVGRYLMSEILLHKLKEIDPHFPTPLLEEKHRFEDAARKLRNGYYD